MLITLKNILGTTVQSTLALTWCLGVIIAMNVRGADNFLLPSLSL
jgi:hypothetical protein